MKACHAGKPVPEAGIREGRCGSRMPHTCRDGSRRNSIPDGSPIPSCSRAGNNDACIGRKEALVQDQRQNSIPSLGNRSGKDQDTRTARYNPRCFSEAQRDQDKISGSRIRKYPDRRHDRQDYKVTKNRLQSIEIKYNQSASPQILNDLSSVFCKKSG